MFSESKAVLILKIYKFPFLMHKRVRMEHCCAFPYLAVYQEETWSHCPVMTVLPKTTLVLHKSLSVFALKIRIAY